MDTNDRESSGEQCAICSRGLETSAGASCGIAPARHEKPMGLPKDAGDQANHEEKPNETPSAPEAACQNCGTGESQDSRTGCGCCGCD